MSYSVSVSIERNNCEICGKFINEVEEALESELTEESSYYHQECKKMADAICFTKSQIKDLEKRLLDEEFALFCKKYNK